MTGRERFLDYVRNGGPPICSPQIGAGAGFDTKMVGKEWISRTTLEDTLKTVAAFDIVPLLNLGLCDPGDGIAELAWRQTSLDDQGDRVTREYALDTPHGTLTRRAVEDRLQGGFGQKSPVTSADELPALEWYIDTAVAADWAFATESVRRQVDTIAGRGPLSVQWATQPYELLCFANTVDTVLLAADCPETFRRLMDKILLLDAKLLAAVAAGGADFIFLGGPGAEMLSPTYYEEFIVPYSIRASDMAHDLGLLVYSHICSPIEPFLSMGYYNRMGIDLFETLSPPPVGNVASLADALSKIDPDICTRGNLGLDVLLQAGPDAVREATEEILAASAGRKHIVAASDYLFYDVPAANVHAMAAAVRG